jgi:hypothetical protein
MAHRCQVRQRLGAGRLQRGKCGFEPQVGADERVARIDYDCNLRVVHNCTPSGYAAGSGEEYIVRGHPTESINLRHAKNSPTEQRVFLPRPRYPQLRAQPRSAQGI